MTSVVQQCINWNKTRYEQELDLTLALNLLSEETEELFDANNIIETLDAVGDMSFVAIGVLWKAGIRQENIEAILAQGEDNNISSCSTFQAFGTFGAVATEVCADDNVDSVNKLIACQAALLAIWQGMFVLKHLGLQEEYFNIVKAICDSNDTKVVCGKTAANVKANIDKGATYIPPTMSLQRIIAKYELEVQTKH